MKETKKSEVSETPFSDIFWERVQMPEDTTECWQWRGWKTSAGNGGLTVPAAISATKKSYAISAHVASWLIHYGPLPPNRNVRRKCKNKLCCNPEHLELRPWGRKRKENARNRNRQMPGISPLEQDARTAHVDPFPKPRRIDD